MFVDILLPRGEANPPSAVLRDRENALRRCPSSRESLLSNLLRKIRRGTFVTWESGPCRNRLIEYSFCGEFAIFPVTSMPSPSILFTRRDQGCTASAEWIQYRVVHVAEQFNASAGMLDRVGCGMSPLFRFHRLNVHIPFVHSMNSSREMSEILLHWFFSSAPCRAR